MLQKMDKAWVEIGNTKSSCNYYQQTKLKLDLHKIKILSFAQENDVPELWIGERGWIWTTTNQVFIRLILNVFYVIGGRDRPEDVDGDGIRESINEIQLLTTDICLH